MTTTESSRGLHLLAAVFGGAALGLIAYRFGVLPFTWHAKGSFLFPGLAAGLGVSATRIAKDRGPRPALPLMIVAALVGAAATFGLSYLAVPPLSNARLSLMSGLPGFSLELPAGEADAQKFFDYDVGKIMVKDVAGQGGVISVHWEGGEPSRDDLELAAKALGPAVGAVGSPTITTMTGPRGTAVDTIVLRADKGEMRLSFLPCGLRRVMVATMVGDDTEKLHARILPTFLCKPDPQREATMTKGVVPLVVQLPGWFASERDPGQVVLTDGSGTVLLKTMPSSATNVEEMVVPMFNAAGAKLAITGHQGDRALLGGEVEGTKVDGWVRSVKCGQQSVIVVAIAVNKEAADLLATQLASARCVKPNEAPTTWPDVPPAAPATP